MSNDEPERPRSEPEIIPPGRAIGDDRGRDERIWTFGSSGSHRVFVGRIGPFGMFMLALAGAALSILLLIFIVGAFLIWIPIVGLIVAALILSSLLRSIFQGPR